MSRNLGCHIRENTGCIGIRDLSDLAGTTFLSESLGNLGFCPNISTDSAQILSHQEHLWGPVPPCPPPMPDWLLQNRFCLSFVLMRLLNHYMNDSVYDTVVASPSCSIFPITSYDSIRWTCNVSNVS